MNRPMQGVEATITGKVHEIKVHSRGPVTLVVQVSHGKDKKTEQWKPSSWYNIKVFDSKQAALGTADPRKGDLITVTVWGATEEWTGKDGQKRSEKAWYLSSFTLHREGEEPAAAEPAYQPATVQPIADDDIPF